MKTLNPELAAEFALVLSVLLSNRVQPAAATTGFAETHSSNGAIHRLEVDPARQ